MMLLWSARRQKSFHKELRCGQQKTLLDSVIFSYSYFCGGDSFVTKRSLTRPFYSSDKFAVCQQNENQGAFCGSIAIICCAQKKKKKKKFDCPTKTGSFREICRKNTSRFQVYFSKEKENLGNKNSLPVLIFESSRHKTTNWLHRCCYCGSRTEHAAAASGGRLRL